MTTRQIPWARIFAEGVAIVVSILLAFGIQAWWENRQEREALRQDLVNVAEELQADRAAILFSTDVAERMTEGSTVVADMLAPSTEVPTIAVQDTLAFLVATIPGTLDMSLGALDALISSGRIATVEDADLRERLAGLHAAVEDATEGQQIESRRLEAMMTPVLQSSYDLTLMYDVNRTFWNGDPTVGRPLISRGLVDMPNSVAVLNYLHRREGNLRLTAIELRGLLAEVDSLVELIDHQI